jgi:hypothetical protein
MHLARLLTLLAALLLCAPSHAQTVKSLGFNTTNGQVVANTGTNRLTFGAPLSLSNNNASVAFQVADEYLNEGYDGNVGDVGFGGGSIWLKYGTNQIDWGQVVALGENGYAGLRADLSLGNTNNVFFGNVNLATNGRIYWTGFSPIASIDFSSGLRFFSGTNQIVNIHTNGLTLAISNSSLRFESNNTTGAAITRTNLGLGLPALTNTSNTNFLNAVLGAEATNYGLPLVYDEEQGWIKRQLLYDAISDWADAVISGAIAAAPHEARNAIGLPLPALTQTSNVTMMRALAGSTNTNAPFSGSVSVVGTNNTNTMVFTNGILLEVAAP